MLANHIAQQDVQFRQQKKLNYLVLARLLFSRWYWIIIALIIGLMIAYVYLAYVPPLYATSALLKFDEKKSEISELINVRNIYDRTDKIESEKSVIRSRKVLQRAIQSLDYSVSFYPSKGFDATELYPHKPVKIEFSASSRLYQYKNFEFKTVSDSKYQLCYNYQNEQVCDVYKYGQNVSLPGLKLKVLAADKKLKKGTTYLFKLNDQITLVERINKSLKLDETQNISLLYLKYMDHNPILATDILNAIVKEYINYDKIQRATAASQTVSFINTLLQTMADTVKRSGLAIQEFKLNNQSLAITDNLNILTTRLSNLHIEKHTLDLTGLLISSMENSLKEVADYPLAYNFQISPDVQLNQLLSKYNDPLSKRKQLLTTYTEDAPAIKQLDQQIDDARLAITQNISHQRQHNLQRSDFLIKQIESVNRRLADLPKTERTFVTLQARFDINQKVYSYLAEKKLEAEISKAAVTSGAVIIDNAILPEKAISPIPNNVFILSAALGTLLSIVIIYVVHIRNPYIYNKDAIEEYSKSPIIGVIRRYRSDTINKHSAITIEPRSIFSESVRSVRSNLNFFASEMERKVICITSEISGEGKSFIASNLAISLTLTQKKVLLIAADLRKSKLHDNFNVSNLNGLSIFLSGQVLSNKLPLETEFENLDLIPSGPVPPNPSELLLSKKMLDLVDEYKKHYDYIIIDTAPIGLVADAKPLLRMADITLFILRSGISKRYFSATPDLLKTELDLAHISIILNDYDDRNLHSHYYTNNHTIAKGSYYHPVQGNYRHEDYLEL